MKILKFPEHEDDKTDYLSAEHWRIAEEAENGNRYCMRGLAEIYESMWHRADTQEDQGRDISARPEKLFRLAFQWRVKAAEAGDRESMRWLSVYMVRYQKDYHITEAEAGGHSALDWQKKAAEAGDRYAEKWMGDLYSDPYYEDFDQEKAQNWYQRSAASGCIYAMHELGVRYRDGVGCVADEKEALYWFRRSGEQIGCWRDLSGIEIRMVMEDIAKAGALCVKKEMNEEEILWLREHLERSLKLADRIAVEPSLVRELRKLRLRLNEYV